MGTATTTFNTMFAPVIRMSPLFQEAILLGGRNVTAAIDQYEALLAPTQGIANSASAVAMSLSGAFTKEGMEGSAYATQSIMGGVAYAQAAATKFAATDENEVFFKPANNVANATAQAVTVGVSNAAGAGSVVLANLQSVGTTAFEGGKIFGNDYTRNIAQGGEVATSIAANAQEVLFALGNYLQGNDPVAFATTVQNGINGIITGSVEGNLTGDDDSVVQNIQDTADGVSANLADAAVALFDAGADGGNFLSSQVSDDIQRGSVAILDSAEDLVGVLPTNGVQNLGTATTELGQAVDAVTSQPQELSVAAEEVLIASSLAVNGVGKTLADNFYSKDTLEGPIGNTSPEAGNLAEGVVEGTDQIADYMMNLGDFLLYNNGSNTSFMDEALAQFIVGEIADADPPQSETVTGPLNAIVFEPAQTAFADGADDATAGLATGTGALSTGIDMGQAALSDGIIDATQGMGAATFGLRTAVSEFQNRAEMPEGDTGSSFPTVGNFDDFNPMSGVASIGSQAENLQGASITSPFEM